MATETARDMNGTHWDTNPGYIINHRIDVGPSSCSSSSSSTCSRREPCQFQPSTKRAHRPHATTITIVEVYLASSGAALRPFSSVHGWRSIRMFRSRWIRKKWTSGPNVSTQHRASLKQRWCCSYARCLCRNILWRGQYASGCRRGR